MSNVSTSRLFTPLKDCLLHVLVLCVIHDMVLNHWVYYVAVHISTFTLSHAARESRRSLVNGKGHLNVLVYMYNVPWQTNTIATSWLAGIGSEKKYTRNVRNKYSVAYCANLVVPLQQRDFLPTCTILLNHLILYNSGLASCSFFCDISHSLAGPAP